MYVNSQHLRRSIIISLLTVLLLGLSSWGGAFYARPPYNIKFVWPSTDWRFSLYDESETLQAALIKGSGAEEQAALIIKAYPLGDFEDPDALILFHWMMESDYRSGVDDFERLSAVYECQVGDEKGYRVEMRHKLYGEEFLGSIVSFSKGHIFYQLVFMSLAEAYESVKSAFEAILGRIEFFDSPHPLVEYVPSEILGLKMPIVESSWPSEEKLGISLITSKVVSYGSDASHTVLLTILEESNELAATERALTLGSEMRGAIEEWLGSTAWDQSIISLYGLSLQCWESVASRMGNSYYVGLLTWSFGNNAYLLRIFGPSRDYSHGSLIEAARAALRKMNP